MDMFCDMADYIRDLLCCDGVCLVLRCFDSALSHPQLARVFTCTGPSLGDYESYHGSIITSALLSNERVRATCDMAMQTGSIWCLTVPEDGAEQAPLVVVAPLERPGGCVGTLLCTSARADTFGYGELCLLQQSMVTLAQRVEETLSRLPVSVAEQSSIVAVTDRSEQSVTDTDLRELTGHTLHEQNELLSIVSHDLRIPLSIIKGYIGLLQVYGDVSRADQKSYGPVIPFARQQFYLNIVMEQINHLEVLISDLLDMSRIQSGRMNVTPTEINLVPLCQRIARQMQDQFDQREPGHYSICCIPERDVMPVQADLHRVQQILVNLLENAVKYSPEGGLIEILIQAYHFPQAIRSLHTVDREPPSIAVTIRDHGIGIPNRQQAALFKPFKRLDNSTTRQCAGSGLGLYIVRLLVNAMNGRIILKSQEGKGTSITFTLPLAVRASSPQQICNPRGCLQPQYKVSSSI